MLNQALKNHFPRYKDALETSTDPRTKNWFLLWQDPTGVILLTLGYLLFVLLGPRHMRHRKALHVPSMVLFIYNIGLVLLSIYMFEEILVGAIQSGYSLQCQPMNVRYTASEMKVTRALWWYFISKAIEFMDTVFMIIRKKQQQVTFLHVFHHSSMLCIWWIVMTWIPGGQAWFGPVLNSAVHVMMYTYYGLAAFPSLRSKLWWKKYITISQLLQFGFILTHTMQGILTGCTYPMWGQWLLGGYMIIMLLLFTNFYVREYITRTNEVKRRKLSLSKLPSATAASSRGTKLNAQTLISHVPSTPACSSEADPDKEDGFSVTSNGSSSFNSATNTHHKNGYFKHDHHE